MSIVIELLAVQSTLEERRKAMDIPVNKSKLLDIESLPELFWEQIDKKEEACLYLKSESVYYTENGRYDKDMTTAMCDDHDDRTVIVKPITDISESCGIIVFDAILVSNDDEPKIRVSLDGDGKGNSWSYDGIGKIQFL
jgi:hypothetical protein